MQLPRFVERRREEGKEVSAPFLILFASLANSELKCTVRWLDCENILPDLAEENVDTRIDLNHKNQSFTKTEQLLDICHYLGIPAKIDRQRYIY